MKNRISLLSIIFALTVSFNAHSGAIKNEIGISKFNVADISQNTFTIDVAFKKKIDGTLQQGNVCDFENVQIDSKIHKKGNPIALDKSKCDEDFNITAYIDSYAGTTNTGEQVFFEIYLDGYLIRTESRILWNQYLGRVQ